MRRFRGADSGYSLAEMMVVILMFTLVAGSITAVVITTLKHQNSLADRASVLARTRNSLEQVDRDIRSANPLCYATGSEFVAWESAPVGAIVDYKFDTTRHTLTYTRYTPTVTQNGALNPTISCPIATTTGTGTTTTTEYESAISVSRSILTNVTSGSFTAYVAQATAPTFYSCAGTGATTPNYPAATAMPTAMIVNVSVQPASLSKPVSTSDCGTYIRNYPIS